MCTVLRRQGYSVLDASNADGALRICDVHKGNIQMLLTDVTMPHMNGLQLAHVVTGRDPQIKVLFVSGYPAETSICRKSAEAGPAFLPKPFTNQELAQTVSELLKQAGR